MRSLSPLLRTVTLLICGCFSDPGELTSGASTRSTSTVTSETGTTAQTTTAGASSSSSATSASTTATATATATGSTTSLATGTGITDGTDGTTCGAPDCPTSTTEPSTGSSSTGAPGCDAATFKLTMTAECHLGTDISSPAYGHDLCAAEFGPEWRWIEHHEDVGWSVKGTWESPVGVGERAWVWINDQTGNCWESTHGMTWLRPEGGSCIASCHPDTGLEGEGFIPYRGKCNPSGDTPCTLCRPLICVSG